MDSNCHVPSALFSPAEPFESLNWRDTDRHANSVLLRCDVSGALAIVIYARGMAGDCDSYQCGRVHGRQAVSGRGWQ